MAALIYLFEYEGPGGGWEPVGTGDGHGVNPVGAAFEDLAASADRELPPGRYRYAPGEDHGTGDWRYLERKPDGDLAMHSTRRLSS